MLHNSNGILIVVQLKYFSNYPVRAYRKEMESSWKGEVLTTAAEISIKKELYRFRWYLGQESISIDKVIEKSFVY